MSDHPPIDPADHAEDFAQRYARDLDAYCAVRMKELGIPELLHGTSDLEGDGRWTAFSAEDSPDADDVRRFDERASPVGHSQEEIGRGAVATDLI